ncbi:MAG: preprotein translocase subunit SecG [Flavobacteriales bacterium]
MVVYLLFAALIAIISVLLILIVMVQNPKGGGLSSSFGGTGSASQMFGVQRTNDFLDRSTWILATAMVALILLSNFAIQRNGFDSSLDNRIERREPPVQAPTKSIAVPTTKSTSDSGSTTPL